MNVFNFLKNLVLVTAVWTMVFEPVAFGLQSQAQFDRITQTQLKMMIVDLGLNKKMTYAQFWNRTKHLYPAQSYKEIEAYFKTQPSSVMPAFEVSYTQNSTGEKVPTLKVTDRGQTYNIQIIGELNEWARVNQVSLSESDLMRLKPAIQKLDPSATKLETYKKDFARFEGFPRMTPVLWKSMKPEERAAYIVKMRLLWFEARRVLEAAPEASLQQDARQKNTKPRKTSSFEGFLKFMIGEEAQATTAADAQAVVRAKLNDKPLKYSKADLSDKGKRKDLQGKPCLTDTQLSGGGCIAAGYVAPQASDMFKSSYTLTVNARSPKTLVCGCDYDAVVEQRLVTAKLAGTDTTLLKANQDKLDKACNEDSGLQAKKSSIPNSSEGRWVACQPEIYSFSKDSGKPFCVHTMSETFQRATTYNGDPRKDSSLRNCDEQSRLGTSGADISKMSEQDRIALMDKEQRGEKGDYLLTKNYLDGMLKAKDKNTTMEKLLDPNSPYDEAMDDFLVSTQKAFEFEIERAMKSCSFKEPGDKQENNHGDACAQLHHRWLFTEKFIGKYRQKSCLDGSEYVGLEGVTSRSKVQPNKAAINTVKVSNMKDMALCQCKAPSTKTVKIGEKCNAEPVLVLITCPDGSKQATPAPSGREVRGTDVPPIVCNCNNSEKSFTLTKDSAQNADLFAKTCGEPAIVPLPPPREDPKPEKQSCDTRYPDASPMDENCICTAGSLKGSTPAAKRKASTNTGGEGEIVYAKDEATSYTCDESKFNPLWLLAGLLAFLGLKKLFKKDDKPPTCGGVNQIWNNSQCVCSFSLSCKTGANADCTGCAVVPTCGPPKSGGSYPACECPNVKTCVGPNWALQGTTCKCDPVEGGDKPENCTGPKCNGGFPAPTTSK